MTATTSNVGVGDLVDGKYRLLRVIGEGGWGIVFEGENARTLRRVAIKILRARADLTADIRDRFEREAQAAGRIGSEHIVEVFDLGTLTDGSHYMVMELLAGEDLACRLRSSGPLHPQLAAKIVIQVLEGLAAAHEAGIMHRDLKPENLFLVPTRSGEDFVKILDFGISKFTTPGVSSATRTGAVLGSPYYMAPEQARGIKNVDPRTDLYSVGTLLFECVTGRVPFDGDNFNDLMFKIALSPRPSPLEFRPDLDLDLVPIISKSIQADANSRFETAEQFRDALIAWLESKGVASVRTPELRRMTRTTPRTPGHLNATPSSFNQRAPNWSDATAALEGGPTPLAGAATVGNIERQKSSKGPLVAMMVAVMAITAVVAALALRHEPGADTAAAAPPSPGLPPTAEAPVAAPTAPAPPAAPAPPTPETATVAELPAAEAAPSHALAGMASNPAHPAGHAAPTAHAAPASAKGAPPGTKGPLAPSESAAAATPPPAPPPPPSAPPAKTVESVEGRAIQTGL
jgi:eukaryotic-like serine/threonine-protein kinase